MEEKNLPVSKLAHNAMSNGVVNFTFNDYQIGRIYFGKRTSKMQLIDADNVEWIENRPFEEYLKNINKWINYAKSLN